jgi:hypothetical protein
MAADVTTILVTHLVSCRSSVVEHSLGKGEVVSSILPGSTIPEVRFRSTAIRFFFVSGAFSPMTTCKLMS